MTASEPMVRADGVTFSRGRGRQRHVVLRELRCAIGRGEFVSLVGRSGGGKSTLVGLIAGTLAPESGQVEFPAGRPKIGVQFQGDALFPWRRLWSNLGYAAEIAGQGVAERRRQAGELCRLVGLDPEVYLDRYPAELSGGERRRLSLAMALAAGPSLLLLDEATGSLDWLTRRQIQEMLQRVCAERQLTTLAVTHDVPEAVWLSDRVLVLRHGTITREFAVDLPRPRTDRDRSRPEFDGLVEAIARELSSDEPARPETR